MTEDAIANNRRPSIATIFNPRRIKSGSSGQHRSKNLHPRPSVVITDEDAPSQALTLTNGGGDVTDTEGGNAEDVSLGGSLGLSHVRERSSIISERGLSINLGARGIGSRASSGSLNVTGSTIKTHPQIQHSHSTGVRHARSPSINLGSSVPSTDADQGKITFRYVSTYTYDIPPNFIPESTYFH